MPIPVPRVFTITFTLLITLLIIPAAAGHAQEYTCSISPLDKEAKRSMNGRAWNEECPVPLDDLVAVEFSHWGFDDKVHTGVLVVHKVVSKEMADIFRELYDLRFPFENIRPYEAFSVGKYAIHNATVGFYCRKDGEEPSTKQIHAFGLAIDINPLFNPCGTAQGWWPKGSDQYTERDGQKGKISLDSEIFKVFTKYGWVWGGSHGGTDYMQFQKGFFGDKDKPMSTWYFAPTLRYGER